jgi:hypothetical protein
VGPIEVHPDSSNAAATTVPLNRTPSNRFNQTRPPGFELPRVNLPSFGCPLAGLSNIFTHAIFSVIGWVPLHLSARALSSAMGLRVRAGVSAALGIALSPASQPTGLVGRESAGHSAFHPGRATALGWTWSRSSSAASPTKRSGAGLSAASKISKPSCAQKRELQHRRDTIHVNQTHRAPHRRIQTQTNHRNATLATVSPSELPQHTQRIIRARHGNPDVVVMRARDHAAADPGGAECGR